MKNSKKKSEKEAKSLTIESQPLPVTPASRLREFAQWTKTKGICKSYYDFEKKCGLYPSYLANNNTKKGNVGAEVLGRVVEVFPQLNLVWICNGKGSMLNTQVSTNEDYRQAYEGAMMQIEALNKIVRKKQLI